MIRSPQLNTYYLSSSSDEVSNDSFVQEPLPILPSITDQLKGHANSITQIINAIQDPREKYEMKRLLEIELSEVLGIYIGHYKPATERLNGYMPSQ